MSHHALLTELSTAQIHHALLMTPASLCSPCKPPSTSPTVSHRGMRMRATLIWRNKQMVKILVGPQFIFIIGAGELDRGMGQLLHYLPCFLWDSVKQNCNLLWRLPLPIMQPRPLGASLKFKEPNRVHLKRVNAFKCYTSLAKQSEVLHIMFVCLDIMCESLNAVSEQFLNLMECSMHYGQNLIDLGGNWKIWRGKWVTCGAPDIWLADPAS